MPEAYINGKRVDPRSLTATVFNSPVGTEFEAVISRRNKVSVRGRKSSDSTYEYFYKRGTKHSIVNDGDANELYRFIEGATSAYLSELQTRRQSTEKKDRTGLPPTHPIETLEPIERGIASTGTRRKVFGRGKRRRSTRRRR